MQKIVSSSFSIHRSDTQSPWSSDEKRREPSRPSVRPIYDPKPKVKPRRRRRRSGHWLEVEPPPPPSNSKRNSILSEVRGMLDIHLYQSRVTHQHGPPRAPPRAGAEDPLAMRGPHISSTSKKGKKPIRPRVRSLVIHMSEVGRNTKRSGRPQKTEWLTAVRDARPHLIDSAIAIAAL